MSNDANIIIHHKDILPGRYTEYFSWSGNKKAQVFIPERYSLDRFPFPLRKVEERFDMDGAYYLRTDVAFWWVTDFIAKVKRIFNWINHRLILTACVWGLGKADPGSIPSWSAVLKRRWG
jgi:hypothetical protein